MPIVEIETKDKIPLFGYLFEAKNSETVLINIHGTAGNFYENKYMMFLAKSMNNKKISVLSTNNRGAGVMHVYPHAGAALEHFEDCILDIDAWIEFALKKYQNIILQGHSLGSEKVVYYMNKGKYKNDIKCIILLGPADSYGETYRTLKNKMNIVMREAKKVAKKNKEQFLTSVWLCHGNVLPKSADSFLNFFSKNSELSKALPLRKGKELELYQRIEVPILIVIGDKEEYTIIPIKKALELMTKENVNAECHQIKNCNHDFENKEKKLSGIVLDFLQKMNL